MKKRTLMQCAAAILTIASMFTGVVSVSAQETELELASEAAVVMDAKTGQILYDKNMHTQLYPASITKILTGMLTLKYGDLDGSFTLSSTAYRAVPRDSSHIGLQVGEAMNIRDSLYAIAIESANDASVGLAESISGSVENFAELMNREAAQMGALHSHFVNPNGLPNDDHYTTAYDMAVITCEALKTPGFADIFGTVEYEIPATNRSKARLMTAKNQYSDGTRPCEGLIFSKTGWTSSALGTLVTAVERDGVTLVAVVMKSAMLEDKYEDTTALLDYAFSKYKRMLLETDTMHRMLLDAGMDKDYILSDFNPVTVMVPYTCRAEDLRVEIPGGFTGSALTIPVSILRKLDSGKYVPLADTLVSVRYNPPATPQPAPAVVEAVKEDSQITQYQLAAIMAMCGSGLCPLSIMIRALKKRRSYETV